MTKLIFCYILTTVKCSFAQLKNLALGGAVMQRFLNFASTFLGVATLSLVGSIFSSPALAVEGYLTLDYGQECGQIDTSRIFHDLEGGNENTIRALRTVTSCFEANNDARIQPLQALVQNVDEYRQQQLVYSRQITATPTGDVEEEVILRFLVNFETAEIEEHEMIPLREFPSWALAQGVEVSEVQVVLESLVWNSPHMGGYTLGSVFSPSGEDLGPIESYGSQFVKDWAVLGHLASPPIQNGEDHRTLNVRLVDPHSFLITRGSDQGNPSDVLIVLGSPEGVKISPPVYQELSISPGELPDNDWFRTLYEGVWAFPAPLVEIALEFADSAQ